MNDIAFLAMDLEHHGRPDLAAWFVSAYAEEGGDYAGLPMKVLWALLDVAAIALLYSGLVLWWRRTRVPAPALATPMDSTA